jgi:DNA helicase-2/ATP-dependent DNA helicase PcrA
MKEIELNLNNYISDDKEDKKIKKEIIEYEGKNNLVIIACAGAGKTSTMVERIIYLLNKNVDPKSIVVFTYTNMAATELTLRIHSKAKEINKDILVSQIFIGTIHSFCQNLLKELSSEYKNCNLLDETQFSLFCYRYFNEIKLCDYLPFERKYNNHIKNSFTIIDYMKLIDLINENYIFLENEKIEELPQQLKWIYESLRKQMISKNRKTIFSFILRDIVEKLKTDNDIKKMFLEKKIKYLIVDEYQDMNKVQEALVEQMHILGAQVYAVGDDDQAIYKFRGGDNK